MNDLVAAAILGVVQGVTEFLPVSSSGHLVLFQQWLPPVGDHVAFDLVLHGATGFTGGLAAREIARSAPHGLKWAVSARNPERIAQLGFELGVESIGFHL